MKRLLEADAGLFRIINEKLSNGFFDQLMPLLRSPWFWTPLYLFLLAYIVFRHGKAGWLAVFFAVLTAALCDQVSSGIVKELVTRLRPCSEPSLAETIHVLVRCGGNSSFTSSHAANHFGLAVFLLPLLKSFGHRRYLLLFWAFIVCFAQVYVGVHYPLDVICGGLLGAGIGAICRYLYKFAQTLPT